MNTNDIKEFALAEYRKAKGTVDNWVSFSDDWGINIYQPDTDETTVTCDVYPVIDGEPVMLIVYEFEFPREVQNEERI